jgi:hypothetical protein
MCVKEGTCVLRSTKGKEDYNNNPNLCSSSSSSSNSGLVKVGSSSVVPVPENWSGSVPGLAQSWLATELELNRKPFHDHLPSILHRVLVGAGFTVAQLAKFRHDAKACRFVELELELELDQF